MNDFGRTGLKVAPLGFGAMHLNDGRVTETEAEHLLNAVLDLGVNLIDTARGYGLSEERIGRHLAHRRQEFLISTKVGYGIPGVPDWTGPCITAGVEAALTRLRRERLDIVHLHSCPLATLERGEVIDALEACARAGKVGVVAYSGDNAELDFAVSSGRFGSVQTSIGNREAMQEDWFAGYRAKYCMDEDFLAAVTAAHKERPGEFSAPFSEERISYILTTGGNWAAGTIGKFKLTVDKGNPKALVSFCGDNVKKTGPTTFEMTANDFYPEHDIDILILDPSDNN